MAQTAWDLQRVSGGRLLLGLGTQVRAHVERRFSAPFEHPAARIVDYIRCLRAIWATFQNGVRPAYEGRFYRFTLISDFFNPGPIEHPDIPISLAGVGERMARAAGEAADGFHVHPLHSPGYLRDVVRPAIAEAARAARRDPAQVALIAPVFIITGETARECAAAESYARQQIAFYASTPTYRPFLAYHGFEALGKELSVLAREGRFADMPARVPDALLDAVAVRAEPAALGAAIRARYAGDLVQRLYPYAPIPADDPGGRLAALVAGIRHA
jgi:probable F420-dependent oxidoreductase